MTRYLFLVLLMIGIAGGTVQAQTLGDITSNIGAYYRFADPTDITIDLKVWGAVSNPGLYEVRQGMRLSTLLSLAGGPQGAERTTLTRRTLTIRLWRPQPNGGPYESIFETQMQDEIVVLNDDPVLLSGDVIVADEVIEQRFRWRDFLSVVTAIASIVLVVDNVFYD